MVAAPPDSAVRQASIEFSVRVPPGLPGSYMSSRDGLLLKIEYQIRVELKLKSKVNFKDTCLDASIAR